MIDGCIRWLLPIRPPSYCLWVANASLQPFTGPFPALSERFFCCCSGTHTKLLCFCECVFVLVRDAALFSWRLKTCHFGIVLTQPLAVLLLGSDIAADLCALHKKKCFSEVLLRTCLAACFMRLLLAARSVLLRQVSSNLLPLSYCYCKSLSFGLSLIN